MGSPPPSTCRPSSRPLRASTRAALAVSALLLLAPSGCGTADDGDDGLDPGVAGEAGKADLPGYALTLQRHWLTRGDALTPSDNLLGLRLTTPVNGRFTYRIRTGATGLAGQLRSLPSPAVRSFQADIDVASLPPGEYKLEILGDGPVAPPPGRLTPSTPPRPMTATRPGTPPRGMTPSTPPSTMTPTTPPGEPLAPGVVAQARFTISFPLYVVVSTDWDHTRLVDGQLERMERLRASHPELVLSHFFAPYHYTDPAVTPDLRQRIEDWVLAARNTHGDEIGVHIHGYCHYVEAAGVPCNVAPSFRDTLGIPGTDDTGYTTILASYSEDQMVQLLDHARTLYADHGLGDPTSFRAGGWTADGGTLRALVRTGFTVESSAVPADKLEEWNGRVLFDWTSSHWTGITPTTQPYYPAADDITIDGAAAGLSTLPILEVPDNGALVDYVTGPEMASIFDANYPGGALDRPTLYQVGFHPPNFSEAFLSRMQIALAHADGHLHSKDAGPVRYVRISDLKTVFP